ncbi:hypothetical protein [uncultured Dechloromonas sp.]|uniref:hypothetical protein n=1 Tax=uncultured Dechloromonas sp. TaxID=171719 RepID=UPI0025F756F6|nr:hypothetical protein [uncultured Dechloromonas sp.]
MRAYPETWLEQKVDGDLKLKSTYKKRQPVHVRVNTEGYHTADGTPGWFIPGSFGFCLRCGVVHPFAGKESLRLTGLSGEGRSSATTMLTLSALRYLYEEDDQLQEVAKKVLGFTDNRQDAALQVGHFNDFLQVMLQRAALLAAVQKAGGSLTESEVSDAVFRSLGFDRDDPGVRAEYMQEPDIKGNARRQVQDIMRAILGYRVYFDLRRGWRFNNPNLEQLGLVHIEYQDLDDLVGDASEWSDAPLALQAASPVVRKRLLVKLFDAMRQGLCLASRYLDRTELDKLKTSSFANLREPWGLTEDENPVAANWFITTGKPRDEDRRNVEYLVSGSSRSKLGKEFKRPSTWRETSSRSETLKALTKQVANKMLGADGFGVFNPESDLRPFELGVGGEAYQVLEVLLGDITTLLDSAVSELSLHPGLIVHDCPREADMSERLYRDYLSLVREAEGQLQQGNSVPFQYIVTTTSPPPASLCQAPYLVLELKPGDEQDSLFKKRLDNRLPGF